MISVWLIERMHRHGLRVDFELQTIRKKIDGHEYC